MQTSLLKKPIITEKSLHQAASENKYTIEVERRATKNQIKAAVEETYGVTVESVQTITGHRVRKTTGRKRMKTVVAPRKKAIIRLKAGQKIDVFEFGGQEEAQ